MEPLSYWNFRPKHLIANVKPPAQAYNRRILIIDDNQAIHKDFRKVLTEAADTGRYSALRTELFGTEQSQGLPRFEIDSAFQGQGGLDRVKAARAASRPYAMAFIDVRMPPGWDGIETTVKLWEVDPDLQVVICTAYSDYSWDEMSAKIGQSDRLLILKKPFDNVEVLQLANALTEKWRLLQDSKWKLGDLQQAVAERTQELERSRIAALNMMEDAVEARRKTEQANNDLQREIVERKQIEAHLRETQKMEAIGQLAGGIAHDFNNILGCINGYTELAAMEAGDNPAVNENLEEVIKAGRRAKDLVLQILTFSRQQEQERTPMKLPPVINEALKLLRASLPSTISIRSDISADLPTVIADETQIHQVIMNLATNAAHAMSGRPGELTVKVESMEIDADFVRTHPDLKVGRYVRVSVSDTGSGMDRATVERIFEPFFTTKAPGQGTGLGLSVVHGIIKAHEGAITVYSEPGQGTTFHLYFPAQGDEAAARELKAGAPARGNGERILFVDDEQALAFLGRKMLERVGYRVTPQTSAQEALRLFSAQPNDYDLVITDLTMPNMTGIDLAGELLKIRPDLPIILTTGFGGSITGAKAQALGLRELIMKPTTAHSLAEAVQRALKK